jgi:hypothetical protein
LQTFECLVENIGANSLRDVTFALFNDWGEATTVHELQEDPETLSVIKGVEASDYVIVVIAHFHDTQLICDDLSLFRVFGLDELQSVLLAIIFTLNQEDSGETTITDFLHYFVIL